MSDDRRYAEREVRQRERDAYCAGAGDALADGVLFSREITVRQWAASRLVHLYPFPKIERTRVVADPHDHLGLYYSARPDFTGALAIHWSKSKDRHGDPMWSAVNFPVCVTAERLKIWAHLIAFPTEQVTDDDAPGTAGHGCARG